MLLFHTTNELPTRLTCDSDIDSDIDNDNSTPPLLLFVAPIPKLDILLNIVVSMDTR